MTAEYMHKQPAERALAEAKTAFRVTMIDCEPFADLIVGRLADKDDTSALPDFGCEPWRYRGSAGEPNGFGVRLNFSATSADEGAGMSVSQNVYEYVKVAELDGTTMRPTALIEELKTTKPDLETAQDAARAITIAYIHAYNDLQNAEVSGDAIVFDPTTGIAELESVLDRTVQFGSE